jgi:hypothetical protein
MEEQERTTLLSGEDAPPPARNWYRTGVALAVLSVGAVVAVVAVHPQQKKTASFAVSGSRTVEAKALHVKFDNEYSGEGWRAYPFLADKHLVEPFRKTKVAVKAGTDGQTPTACTFVTEAAQAKRPTSPYDDVHGVESLATFTSSVDLSWEEGDVAGGGFVGHVHFPQPSTYKATVSCDVNGKTVQQVETVESLYVRRELRRLTDEDRNDFFDALVYLYKVTNDEAVQQYGPSAISMHKLLSGHLSLVSADTHLDHLHAGLGFLTHHTALTARAEFSLQAINPRLSMPYWDFTIDSQWMKKNNVKTLSGSIVFSKDWFGELNTEEHTVTEGRWAYLRVPQKTTSGEDSGFPASPYGYLRGPWNLNESPYVTRFVGSCGAEHEFELPSCGAHLGLVQLESSWRQVGDLIKQNAVHDGAHLYTGGVGGECTQISEKVREVVGDEVTKALIQITPATMQWMYRAHIQKPPTTCVPGADCKFTCTQNITAATVLIEELFDHFGYSDEIDLWKNNPRKEEAFTMMFCETKVVLGDAIDAGGANDPTFWPIHPTLERLYQYKDLIKPIKNLYWPSGGVDPTLTDDDVPCYSMWYSSDCKDHHAYDKIAFFALQKNSDGNYERSLPTNKELLHAMSPANGDYAMPYVYENFDWEHCAKDGYVFPAVE